MSNTIPSTSIKFIKYFLSKFNKSVFLLLLFSSVLGCYGTTNSYLIKKIIDSLESIEDNMYDKIIMFSTLFVINYEIQNISWRIINFININFLPKIRQYIVVDLFAHINNHNYNFFQKKSSKVLAGQFRKLEDNFELILNNVLIFIARTIMQILLVLITIYIIYPLFSLIIISWLTIFLSISIFYSKKIRFISENHFKARNILEFKLNDIFKNMLNVRLHNNKVVEINQIKQRFKLVKKTFKQKNLFLLKLWWVQGFSISLLIAITLILLIKLIKISYITTGEFVFILGSILHIAENVWWLTNYIDSTNNALGELDNNLHNILSNNMHDNSSKLFSLNIIKGKIEFSNVGFGYDRKNKIFQNISLVVEGGQKVGIIGFSGSGKTTFINLLLRLIHNSSGKITVDGQDISEIKLSSLYNNISVITQDIILFNRSIFDNIVYSKIGANLEEVVKAAKLAQIHEFIISTSNGYDTIIGEQGMELSGGQKQRIGLARRILKDSPILIADEPTSNLDTITENIVQNNLIKLAKISNKTMIVVTHQLNILLNMDRILVFNEGKIIEDGTHEYLIKTGKFYKSLWNQ